MSKEKICGIYKITSPTGRVYIGKSKDLKTRWRHYKNANCKKQRRLYRSFLKYKVDSHIFEIIEECLFEDLNCRERYWQDHYDVLNGGLNCFLTECGEISRKFSEESKKRIGDANRGEKNGMYGKKGELHHNYGKTFPSENNGCYGKIYSDLEKQEMSVKISKIFEDNPDIIKRIKENNSGGVYHTPKGDFISQRDAAKANNIARTTLINWCVNKSNLRVGFDRQTPEEYRGEKTWKEHGFYFTPKNKK